MKKLQRQYMKPGFIAGTCATALLIATVFTGCNHSPEPASGVDTAPNIMVIETDEARYPAPVMMEDLTDDAQRQYVSFIAYMVWHTSQPRFAFKSADHLSERDKFEFACLIQGFLAQQDLDAERELLSWQDGSQSVSRIPVSAIKELVKTYLGADFDPIEAFGVSEGISDGGSPLGFDQAKDEYAMLNSHTSNSSDEDWRAGLLGFTETDGQLVEMTVGFYSSVGSEDADRAGYTLHYDLRYAYDVVIRENRTNPNQFTVMSSVYKVVDSEGGVRTLGTPWDYQTPGWSEDIPRALANMDNAVTQPGDEMSEEDVLAVLYRLLPAGFEVRMWYLDNGAQTLTPSGTAPITIDGRGEWYSIGRYRSINEMKAATLTVLSEEFCERNLYPDAFEDEENVKYKEFGLQLYENQNTGGVEDYISFHSHNIEVVSQQADELVISVPWSRRSDENAVQSVFDFRLIRQDGRWVFDNWPTL